jgi:hypothetical protein
LPHGRTHVVVVVYVATASRPPVALVDTAHSGRTRMPSLCRANAKFAGCVSQTRHVPIGLTGQRKRSQRGQCGRAFAKMHVAPAQQRLEAPARALCHDASRRRHCFSLRSRWSYSVPSIGASRLQLTAARGALQEHGTRGTASVEELEGQQQSALPEKVLLALQCVSCSCEEETALPVAALAQSGLAVPRAPVRSSLYHELEWQQAALHI